MRKCSSENDAAIDKYFASCGIILAWPLHSSTFKMLIWTASKVVVLSIGRLSVKFFEKIVKTIIDWNIVVRNEQIRLSKLPLYLDLMSLLHLIIYYDSSMIVKGQSIQRIVEFCYYFHQSWWWEVGKNGVDWIPFQSWAQFSSEVLLFECYTCYFGFLCNDHNKEVRF